MKCPVCCGNVGVGGRRGRSPKYCSSACRQAAYRQRRKRNALPSDMRRACRWTRAAGKRPIRTDGRPASSTRPETWESFGEVQGGAGDGFGIMLGGGLACIDLDDCVRSDGSLTRTAREVLERNPGCFVEYSVSGRGLHVFGLLEERRGARSSGVEVYSRARFIRVTGKCFRPGGLESLAVDEGLRGLN